MADVGLRDREAFGSGGRREEPTLAPPVTAPGTSTVLARPAKALLPSFGGDPASLVDALGIEPTLAQLAELAAHRSTAAPLTIGVLGGAGSGRSFALSRLTSRIRDLAAAAGKTRESPFFDRIHVQAIDAAALDGDPATALAARLHAGLRDPYPALAREIGHSARDPHAVLRETNEKLDDARRRLDAERRALDDAGSRRARIVETVLYEASGSQVDAYARANRAGIENRLHAFGIPGDAIRTYKDLVQSAANSGGKPGLALRSLWAFKGQGKLIVAAILLIAIGVGLGIAIDDQAGWLAELRTSTKAGAPVADWFSTHMGLLGTLRTGAFVLAALCVALSLWRAIAFLQPIFKGAWLLGSDLETRRRDLDGLYAHQTKRVDALDADVERLTAQAAEAERRAGAGGDAGSFEPSPFAGVQEAAQTERFFTELRRRTAGGASVVGRVDDGATAAPQRIVLAIDHLDAVDPGRARDILDALHRTLGGSIVTLVAADPARLDADAGSCERWFGIPLRLDAADRDQSELVRAALGRRVAAAPAAKPDARTSVLDVPIGEEEADLLAELAALAGPTPRSARRFVTLYGLARLDTGVDRRALALMLALANGGTEAEKVAMAEAVGAGDASAPLRLAKTSPRLAAALVDAGPISHAEASAAARRAALFSLPA